MSINQQFFSSFNLVTLVTDSVSCCVFIECLKDPVGGSLVGTVWPDTARADAAQTMAYSDSCRLGQTVESLRRFLEKIALGRSHW